MDDSGVAKVYLNDPSVESEALGEAMQCLVRSACLGRVVYYTSKGHANNAYNIKLLFSHSCSR